MTDNDFKENFFRTVGSELQELKEADAAPLVIHNLTNQVTYVVQGKGIGVIGDEKKFISKGDILLIPMKTKHSFRCCGDSLVLYHYHWPKDDLETDRVILQNKSGME